ARMYEVVTFRYTTQGETSYVDVLGIDISNDDFHACLFSVWPATKIFVQRYLQLHPKQNRNRALQEETNLKTRKVPVADRRCCERWRVAISAYNSHTAQPVIRSMPDGGRT
ncbi:MAG: hypothetical protein M3R35_00245, partial [Candidatus Eremiobacteraeota bacterium]|nr:hypothetical protein [Candidatus Eremiobacteraeota bacterium]